MALKGVKVIEMAGLAPAPFCGMILADFGASVIRVDRVHSQSQDTLARGKKSIAVDLKHPAGIDIIRRLCGKADVLIEPFRKGIMEKLNLGPDALLRDNPRLIYARLTGYGQEGPYCEKAGHDINYIATSGVLGALGRHNENPHAPVNLLADFGGGGLVCALGILMALQERSRSNLGQVIDANMVEGSAYLASWLWSSRSRAMIWGQPRGRNLLDGGSHFYDTYKTKDDLYMAVGALEPQFFKQFVKVLGLRGDDANQVNDPDEMKVKISQIFLTKTQKEWTDVFENKDSCVTPVYDLDTAPDHPHNAFRESFVRNSNGGIAPRPAPRLSRTPGIPASLNQPISGQHTREVLLNCGYSRDEIDKLSEKNVIECQDVLLDAKL